MDEENLTLRDTLNAQQAHWEKTFSLKPDMFGRDPSEPARRALEFLQQEGKTLLLELGCGQGRDTLFFARNGFHVTAADYSQAAVRVIEEKARIAGMTQFLTALRLDVRQPFPFADRSFEACYSHMLYCMALTTPELDRLSREVWRVLKPGGINIFTVRHTGDPHCGTGIHRGEDMWEVGGFIVHFFRKEKVLRLAESYEIVSIAGFEEGGLPRKLFWVALRKG
jgi:SAM-dependent methyltransferase